MTYLWVIAWTPAAMTALAVAGMAAPAIVAAHGRTVSARRTAAAATRTADARWRSELLAAARDRGPAGPDLWAIAGAHAAVGIGKAPRGTPGLPVIAAWWTRPATQSLTAVIGRPPTTRQPHLVGAA